MDRVCKFCLNDAEWAVRRVRKHLPLWHASIHIARNVDLLFPTLKFVKRKKKKKKKKQKQKNDIYFGLHSWLLMENQGYFKKKKVYFKSVLVIKILFTLSNARMWLSIFIFDETAKDVMFHLFL